MLELLLLVSEGQKQQHVPGDAEDDVAGSGTENEDC